MPFIPNLFSEGNTDAGQSANPAFSGILGSDRLRSQREIRRPGAGIRPIVPGLRMVGTAFTVKCFVGDARAVALAIDQARQGDVLVIDAGGTRRATPWGSMSAAAAKLRGIAGCVTNGAVRDLDELIEIGLPVFATGVSVRGNVKLQAGQLKIPVSVGGMTVSPGDIVIGDSDGVVVVAADQARAVCERATDQLARENEIMQRIRSGEPLGQIFSLS